MADTWRDSFLSIVTEEDGIRAVMKPEWLCHDVVAMPGADIRGLLQSPPRWFIQMQQRLCLCQLLCYDFDVCHGRTLLVEIRSFLILV
jgi:hypothetical protein